MTASFVIERLGERSFSRGMDGIAIAGALEAKVARDWSFLFRHGMSAIFCVGVPTPPLHKHVFDFQQLAALLPAKTHEACTRSNPKHTTPAHKTPWVHSCHLHRIPQRKAGICRNESNRVPKRSSRSSQIATPGNAEPPIRM